MPWLAELVESSEGSLDVLPVQCLCEFLLHDPPESLKDLEEEDDGKGESQAERHKKKQVSGEKSVNTLFMLRTCPKYQ